MTVELWGGAINILTPDPSADDRWCFPCWMQSEPEQSSSSPQGRQETTQHSLNFGPKTRQRIVKREKLERQFSYFHSE